jgi:hypothetical protein
MSDDTGMVLSQASREYLAKVHPELARRVENLAEALATDLILIQVDAGTRTAEQQHAIWVKGRELPGPIVTHADLYQSNHVIGCAVDVFVENVDTDTPDWDATHPAWQRIVELAPQYGLRDGKSWHDLPHLELEEIPTEPTAEIQALCKAKSVEAVWDKLAISQFDA